jgi:hypothetical protein
MLLGQGYRTPRGVVIDEYGAVMEWLLPVKKRRNLRETCFSATVSTMNLTWSHPKLNPGLPGKKPASSRLSYGMGQSNNMK